MENEIVSIAKQSTPPVTVTALSLMGIQLSDWVYIITIIYLLVQIIYVVKKIIRR